jgi:hypothetical protein
MSKMTDWFPRDANPVRSGWYEVKGDFVQNKTGININHKTTYRFFVVDLNTWFWEHPKYGFIRAGFNYLDQWRGLTGKAK